MPKGHVCVLCGEPADGECECCGDSRCMRHLGGRLLPGESDVGWGDEAVVGCYPRCEPFELSPAAVMEIASAREGFDAVPY